MATIVQTHYLGYWRPNHRRLNCLYQEACKHGNITLQLFMWLPLYSLEEPISEVSLDIVDRRRRNANACCRPSMHALGHCVAIRHLTWRFGMPCTAVVHPKKGTSTTAGICGGSISTAWLCAAGGSISFCNWKKNIYEHYCKQLYNLLRQSLCPAKPARHLSVLCLQNINSNIVTRIDNCIQYHIQLSLHLWQWQIIGVS